MTAALVAMRGVAKRFGAVKAVDGVDLTLAVGDILGLLGENGAGKTSLMNVLFGTYAADEGTIEIVRMCASGGLMRLVRRASAKSTGLVLEITEQSADGRRFERRLTLEKQ